MSLRLHRYLIILIFLSLQFLEGFGFIIKTKPKHLAFSVSESTFDYMRRKKPVVSATAEEKQAVAEFKMITEDEAKFRKIGGIIIGVVTAGKFLAIDHSYSALSAGVFAAISTYRSGSEYQ